MFTKFNSYMEQLNGSNEIEDNDLAEVFKCFTLLRDDEFMIVTLDVQKFAIYSKSHGFGEYCKMMTSIHDVTNILNMIKDEGGLWLRMWAVITWCLVNKYTEDAP